MKWAISLGLGFRSGALFSRRGHAVASEAKTASQIAKRPESPFGRIGLARGAFDNDAPKEPRAGPRVTRLQFTPCRYIDVTHIHNPEPSIRLDLEYELARLVAH